MNDFINALNDFEITFTGFSAILVIIAICLTLMDIVFWFIEFLGRTNSK